MKVAIGADHGGWELKESLKGILARQRYDITDVGAAEQESSDYPDYGAGVARLVSDGVVDRGVTICTTGVGMSIVANKFPRVRAALCFNEEMARLSRAHNNANVLALPAKYLSAEEAERILLTWLDADFEGGGRHERRVNKIHFHTRGAEEHHNLQEEDIKVHSALSGEALRQRENLELIASENYASQAVREACGSVFTNKYAEGYPGKRWYHGCEWVDQIEQTARERALELFGAEHVNVQPHSGSAANMAVYFSFLKPGDTILAMSLDHGGHLTHGHPLNFSGRFYDVVPYGVDRENEQIDYGLVARLALERKPRMIVAGASAYSRIIDFKRLREIADSCGAYLTVDMAHIAGLVAGGCHPSPIPHSDFVTTTTHKTLRGPRGGMILCRKSYAAEIDKQVFPGIQGGPLMHIIAAKAVCLLEALQPEFQTYQQQVVRNARALAESIQEAGMRVVSNGTDNHCLLVDLTATGLTGREAAATLDEAGITVNKNVIPFDKRNPMLASGIRLGTPAVTTRGMKEDDMRRIAGMIRDVLAAGGDEETIKRIRGDVRRLAGGFPVP